MFNSCRSMGIQYDGYPNDAVRCPRSCPEVVEGVQESLYAVFGLCTCSLGINFPDPRDIHYFVEMGCLSVGSALILW